MKEKGEEGGGGGGEGGRMRIRTKRAHSWKILMLGVPFK